jgi:hypothetical protein
MTNRRHRELTKNRIATDILGRLVIAGGAWVETDEFYALAANQIGKLVYNALKSLEGSKYIQSTKRGRFCRLRRGDRQN